MVLFWKIQRRFLTPGGEVPAMLKLIWSQCINTVKMSHIWAKSVHGQKSYHFDGLDLGTNKHVEDSSILLLIVNLWRKNFEEGKTHNYVLPQKESNCVFANNIKYFCECLSADQGYCFYVIGREHKILSVVLNWQVLCKPIPLTLVLWPSVGEQHKKNSKKE